MMTPDDKNIVIRILELLLASTEAAIAKVPIAFRPPLIRKNLDEAADLLKRLKAGV